MTKRRLWILLISAQAVLLGLEVVLRYDTVVRQSALVLTNVATTIGLLLIDRRLRRAGSSLSVVTAITVIAAVWLDALGNFQHLYGEFWWWDRVTHAAGGLAVSALFMDVALARRKEMNLNVTPTLALWFGFLLGQFVAAMYEVSEWLGDWWFATERVRGPYDSPRDLFFNALGGIVIFLIIKKRTKG